jgi:hypothetical protein
VPGGGLQLKVIYIEQLMNKMPAIALNGQAAGAKYLSAVCCREMGHAGHGYYSERARRFHFLRARIRGARVNEGLTRGAALVSGAPLS